MYLNIRCYVSLLREDIWVGSLLRSDVTSYYMLGTTESIILNICRYSTDDSCDWISVLELSRVQQKGTTLQLHS